MPSVTAVIPVIKLKENNIHLNINGTLALITECNKSERSKLRSGIS